MRSKSPWIVLCLTAAGLLAQTASSPAVFGDYHTERPGVFHKITVADLPKPYASESVNNGPSLTHRTAGAFPQVPPGFHVSEYALGLDRPRLVRRAPNGD